MKGVGNCGGGGWVFVGLWKAMGNILGECDRGEEEWRGRQHSSYNVAQIYLTARNMVQQSVWKLEMLTHEIPVDI